MGMKLKSGADLCGFELSRFCVQNDVAIPDAPASGRKYFHTGTGMEGKYSLLGRERIYTGTAWRSAAYVDDLANLDLATNADYLALKEKVDLLSGEVDTDAIINNMKEVTAFLEGFAEDANLMTMLNNKLDKSGGTIETNSEYYPLILATSAELGQTGIKGKIGTTDIGAFVFSEGNTYLYNYKSKVGLGIYDGIAKFGSNTLLHSGNVGEYALKIDGSNTFANHVWLTWMDTDSVKRYIISLDHTNTLLIGYEMGKIGGTTIFGRGIAMRYGESRAIGFFLNSSGNVTIGNGDSAGTDAKLLVGGNAVIGGAITNDKKDTTLSIYSQTEAGIMFQSDGYGGDTAAIYEHKGVGNGLTFAEENRDFIWKTGGGAYQGSGVGTERMRLTNGGKLLIGATNDNGAKLQVNGDITANGTIACKGVAAEGSAPVGTVDKWAGSISTGTKSQTYTHGLGTTDITVAIYEKNGNEWVQILTDVDIVNANTIRVTFGANTTVEHRIVVMG